MKTIKSNTLLIFFIVSSFGLAKAEELQPFDVFVNLRAQIAQSDKSVTEINGIAADMKTAIQAMSLTNDVPVDATIFKLLHESSWGLVELKQRNGFKESTPSDLDDPVIECFALYLEKLQSVIDPDWEWEDVSVANVSPPDGVPFSMPGMDPNAIEDPILRAEYLELIANAARINQRNGRQRDWRDTRSTILFSLCAAAIDPNYPHWTKESVEARFGTSPALLAAIREHWAASE